MNLYRVTFSFDILVAAACVPDARKTALEALKDELPTLPSSFVHLTRLERFHAAWESLPQGWRWDDSPYGAPDSELSNWQPKPKSWLFA